MGAVYPAGLTSAPGETLALTTSFVTIGMPGKETKQAIVYVPSTKFRMHINPAIKAVYFYDNDQSAGSEWIDLTRNLSDRTTTGSGTTLDSITTADRLFICFSSPVRGVRVKMTSDLNDTPSRVMVGEYWTGSAWSGLSVNDGTIVASGKSLGQTGDVTWVAVTDWRSSPLDGANHKYAKKAALDDVDTGVNTDEELDISETGIDMDGDPSSVIVAGDYIIIETEVMYVNASTATGNLVTVTRGVLGSTAASHTTNKDVYLYRIDGPSEVGHWVKFNWTGGDLAADVEIEDLWSINNDTDYGYYRAGKEYFLSFDRRVTGALEFDLAAGSDTAEITWIRTVV